MPAGDLDQALSLAEEIRVGANLYGSSSFSRGLGERRLEIVIPARMQHDNIDTRGGGC